MKEYFLPFDSRVNLTCLIHKIEQTFSLRDFIDLEILEEHFPLHR
jgi:hypothetical protein